jgi:hypothetical protein
LFEKASGTVDFPLPSKKLPGKPGGHRRQHRWRDGASFAAGGTVGLDAFTVADIAGSTVSSQPLAAADNPHSGC